jgi:hypothetical protein
MTIEDALRYEVAASWIVRLVVKSEWIRDVAAIYYAWKTNRKWCHYARSCEPDKDAYLMVESGMKTRSKCSENGPKNSTKTL